MFLRTCPIIETTVVLPLVPVMSSFLDLDSFKKISISVRISIPSLLASMSTSFLYFMPGLTKIVFTLSKTLKSNLPR